MFLAPNLKKNANFLAVFGRQPIPSFRYEDILDQSSREAVSHISMSCMDMKSTKDCWQLQKMSGSLIKKVKRYKPQYMETWQELTTPPKELEIQFHTLLTAVKAQCYTEKKSDNAINTLNQFTFEFWAYFPLILQLWEQVFCINYHPD